MSADFAHAVAAIRSDTMAKALFAITDSDDALRVAIPANVIDAARDDVIFSLCVDSLDSVPDTNSAGHVTGRNVEARGRESGNGGTGGMAGVLFALGGVVDVAEKDGFARLFNYISTCLGHDGVRFGSAYGVGNALPLGVDGELGGLAPRSGRDCSQNLVDGDGHCCCWRRSSYSRSLRNW